MRHTQLSLLLYSYLLERPRDDIWSFIIFSYSCKSLGLVFRRDIKKLYGRFTEPVGLSGSSECSSRNGSLTS